MLSWQGFQLGKKMDEPVARPFLETGMVGGVALFRLHQNRTGTIRPKSGGIAFRQ